MEKFHEGDFNNGCALIHDFFDNNIYLYFENPRQSSFVQLEQKKEEYKMAIGHSTLQKVAVALKCFLLEIASKLLEETLRWAQLNHHETEVQYCLLYKGKLMEKLGDNRLHFTYVEDALVKAQSFNNYALQLHSCMHHIAMELFYDLNKLRKDIGQNRILNSGFIINNAFVKLLSEYKPRKILMQSQLDLYSIRSLMLGQRKDFLHELGFKKKNLFKTQDPIKALFHSSEDPNTMYSDFVHLEALLDEDTSLFYDQWYAFMDGKNNQLKEYQLSFFDAYFQVKILLRRKDLETISTYYRIMEKILALFPEALLLFKFWSLRIEILIAKECYEQAFVSVNFLMKEMQREGYSKRKSY